MKHSKPLYERQTDCVCFHGYEGLIRDIFFGRRNQQLHIHGYRENGDITTPFDMRILSELDRFHLAKDAAEWVYGEKATDLPKKWRHRCVSP